MSNTDLKKMYDYLKCITTFGFLLFKLFERDIAGGLDDYLFTGHKFHSMQHIKYNLLVCD